MAEEKSLSFNAGLGPLAILKMIVLNSTGFILSVPPPIIATQICA